MTGSHEVRGSIPLGSTNHFNDLKRVEETDVLPCDKLATMLPIL